MHNRLFRARSSRPRTTSTANIVTLAAELHTQSRCAVSVASHEPVQYSWRDAPEQACPLSSGRDDERTILRAQSILGARGSAEPRSVKDRTVRMTHDGARPVVETLVCGCTQRICDHLREAIDLRQCRSRHLKDAAEYSAGSWRLRQSSPRAGPSRRARSVRQHCACGGSPETSGLGPSPRGRSNRHPLVSPPERTRGASIELWLQRRSFHRSPEASWWSA